MPVLPSFRFASLGLIFFVAAFAADQPAAPAPAPAPADTGTSEHVKEAIRERLADEIKFIPPPANSAPSPTIASPSATAPAKTTPAPEPTPANKPKDNVTEARATPVTVLPTVEVRRTRITEVDAKLKENEDQTAKEKELTKSSEADKALNNSKVAKALSIFGGQGTSERERVAAERVELLESEHDLLEQIALAKTKAEKDELQKELDELKSLRRDLELNLR